MKSIISLVLLFIITVTILAACGTKSETSDSGSHKITAAEAKTMMDKDSDITILDVRNQDEYDSGHIKGAILLPLSDISEKAKDTLTDTSATILVYCRSGSRSASAATELVNLGYTNIYDFGGIIDWSYGTVK